MQGLKRMLSVVLLFVMVLLIGYSCYTGNRLSGYPEDLDGYKSCVFKAKDGTTVAFTDEKAWYGVGDEPMILLEITEYKDGVISMKREKKVYAFVAIDKETIYDCQTDKLLIRRGDA